MANGINNNSIGANVGIEFTPVPRFSNIFLEDIVLTKPTDFLNIKTGKYIDFQIDIGEHIKMLNKEADDNTLKVLPNKRYSIKVTYLNTWKKDYCANETYIGTTESNEVKIFLTP